MKKILLYTGLVIVTLVGILAINLFIFGKIAARISEGTPIPDYGNINSAILVVDIQEGTTGSVSVTESYTLQADELIHNVNTITSVAACEKIPVIYIKSEVSNPLINILNNTLAEGSPGAELDHRMNVDSDHIITKKKNDSFNNTDLDQLFANLHVNHIYLTGLDAAHCIHHTLQGALIRGYGVTVVEDAVITDPEEQRDATIQQFREMGVEVISTPAFAESLKSRQ